MTKNYSRKTSEFASLLRQLLDETDIFVRSEWAAFLNVSEAAISQWVNDKTVPRPELLRMIVQLVMSKDDAPHNLLQEFEAMASRSANEVSPNWRRFGQSVCAYMLRPLLEGFLLDLKGLKPEAQERILLRTSLWCAEEAGYDVTSETVIRGRNEIRSFKVYEGGLSPRLLEEAETTVGKIEQKVPGFLRIVMNYLTSSPDESLLPMVKAFCVEAVARARTQNNTAPMMLVAKIIESKAFDHSRFDRIWEQDALNAIFLADPDVAILIKRDGDLARLENDPSGDLEKDVRAISGRNVGQYVPVDKLPRSCRPVRIEEVRDAA